MAYFNEKTGELLLSYEDIQMFKECGHNLSGQNKAPSWSENIINWLMGELKEND